MSDKLAFTMTNDTITVVVDGRLEVTPVTSKSFADLQLALVTGDWAKARGLASPAKFVLRWARPELGWNVDIENGVITYKGTTLPEKLFDRMMAMAQERIDPVAWAKFWERVQANPSYRSVTQLYDFMAHAGIPITADGMIMAYKSVRSDYLDHHSGTIDNHPGAVVEMPRNKISDDPRTPCHEGLHVGAHAYARSFGSYDRIIVLCEVDPADVVCVPYDCDSMKVRCCKYRVIKEMGENDALMPDAFYGDKPKKEWDYDSLDGHEGMGSCSSDADDDNDSAYDYDDEDHCEDCGDCDCWGECEEEESEPGLDDDYDYDDDCDAADSSTGPDPVFDRLVVLRELKDLTIDALRKIAGPVYGIKNASKIPGGRNALVEAILATLPK